MARAIRRQTSKLSIPSSTTCLYASRWELRRISSISSPRSVLARTSQTPSIKCSSAASYNQNLWMHHLTEGDVPSSLNQSEKRWRWNAGEEGTPMLRVHVDEVTDAELSTTLDELVAEGARRMLAAALEAEVDAYVSSFTDEFDDQGHRLVVRNGHAVARSLVTGAGPVEVRAPRVDDRRVDEVTGEKMRFRSLDPAALGPEVPQGGRGAAPDVPPRDELGRLRARPGGVLRFGRRAVGLGHHPADHGMAEGT